MEERVEFKSGFTWRSLLAIILAAALFIPISTYTYLLMGTALGTVSVFFVSLLFAEIARLTYAKLTTQEALMVYYGASIGGSVSIVYFLIIYRSYFINSPFAWSAYINGRPLPEYIPSWLTPPPGSSAHIIRNLFHPDFLPVISLYTTMLILNLIADLGLAMFISRIFIEIEKEKYRFPFADVDFSIVDFIGERRPDKVMLLVTSMIPGVLWALIALVGPTFTGIRIIPIPYLDLTWLIQEHLPGAAFGIATVLSIYFSGFVVPFNSAITMLITSIFIGIVFNSLFITTYPQVFPEWSSEYFKGMGLINIINRSFIRVWFAPQIGFGLAAATLMIFLARKGIITLIKSLYRKSDKSILDFPSNLTCLLMFILPSLISVILFHILVPEVPLWVPVFSWLFYGPLIGIVATAVLGTVGLGFTPPSFVWQTLVYLTPYQGYSGFVYQVVQPGSLPAGFSQQVKVALRTGTRPRDLIKLHVTTNVIGWIIGLISLAALWMIAPIPSAAYPNTVYTMPLTAQIDVVTTTRQLRLSAEYVLVPMALTLIVAIIGLLLNKVGIPFSVPGFFSGLFMQPAIAIPICIGSAISRFLMPKIFGKRWGEVRGYIVAGEGLGEGTLIMILMAASLLSKSSWIWPW
ncbi:MAG: hypothetical protein QXL85_08710 [Candidatus Bathyarchaeia archaeon]